LIFGSRMPCFFFTHLLVMSLPPPHFVPPLELPSLIIPRLSNLCKCLNPNPSLCFLQKKNPPFFAWPGPLECICLDCLFFTFAISFPQCGFPRSRNTSAPVKCSGVVVRARSFARTAYNGGRSSPGTPPLLAFCFPVPRSSCLLCSRDFLIFEIFFTFDHCCSN